MIYYKLKANVQNCKKIINKIQEKCEVESSKKWDIIQAVNKILESSSTDDFTIYATNIDKNNIHMIVAATIEYVAKNKIEDQVIDIVNENFISGVTVSIEEVTSHDFYKMITGAFNDNYIETSRHSVMNKLSIDYFDVNEFKLKEAIEVKRSTTYNQAKKEAANILSDRSMLDELGRIYDPVNPEEFYGHPVHYIIKCGSNEAGYKMALLLVRSLLARKRLPGARIERLTDIRDDCYEDNRLYDLMKNAKGNTVVIETCGRYSSDIGNIASAYENVVDEFEKMINKHNKDTLFILIVDENKKGFSDSLISKLQEGMSFITIEEGAGDTKTARAYINRLVKESSVADYLEDSKKTIVLDKDSYKASELHKEFNKWREECVRSSIYKSYANMVIERSTTIKTGKSKQKLDNLIGLEKVKELVEQIIASNVVDKRRRDLIPNQECASRHMLFTGNPGSCKTTVARIIADVLKEEKVLDTGAYVECGRADLVDQYVGWTARKVRSQFRKAQGGILFIDEAYALIDDTRSFGDEAINTIVQEMENHREDTIVIFAGYPDKMEEFLNKNEGLRSRIAFHVDFPDYKVEDLNKILEKMLKDRGYEASKDGIAKAEELFEKATRISDFGNGRFARNVLEQAILKQSVRLYRKYEGREIPKEEINLLIADDFELDNIIPSKKNTTKTFGFCA